MDELDFRLSFCGNDFVLYCMDIASVALVCTRDYNVKSGSGRYRSILIIIIFLFSV